MKEAGKLFFHAVEEFVQNCFCFILKYLIEYSGEAIWGWCFLDMNYLSSFQFI